MIDIVHIWGVWALAPPPPPPASFSPSLPPRPALSLIAHRASLGGERMVRLGAFAASHLISLRAGSLGTGLSLCAIDVTGSGSAPPPSHYMASLPPPPPPPALPSSLAPSSLSPPQSPHRSALGRLAPPHVDRQRTTVRSMLPPPALRCRLD